MFDADADVRRWIRGIFSKQESDFKWKWSTMYSQIFDTFDKWWCLYKSMKNTEAYDTVLQDRAKFCHLGKFFYWAIFFKTFNGRVLGQYFIYCWQNFFQASALVGDFLGDLNFWSNHLVTLLGGTSKALLIEGENEQKPNNAGSLSLSNLLC